MAGDPKQCRMNAMHCAELAATARTSRFADARIVLIELSFEVVPIVAQLHCCDHSPKMFAELGVRDKPRLLGACER